MPSVRKMIRLTHRAKFWIAMPWKRVLMLLWQRKERELTGLPKCAKEPTRSKGCTSACSICRNAETFDSGSLSKLVLASTTKCKRRDGISMTEIYFSQTRSLKGWDSGATLVILWWWHPSACRLHTPHYILVCVLICSVVFDSLQPRGLPPARLLCPWDFPGKNTGVGCHSLLQGLPDPRIKATSPVLADRFF